MRKTVGLVLVLASLACVLWFSYVYFHVGYWAEPPKEKFMTSWLEDEALLAHTKTLPDQWNHIREITVSADNSPIQGWIGDAGWLNRFKSSIPVDPKNGQYQLDIFLIHWIEGYRYGTVMQMHLIDLKNKNNTIWELGRTYKLGIIY